MIQKQIQTYGAKIIITNTTGGKNTGVCAFDVNEEIQRHEPWTGNSIENKKMIDKFIQGGTYKYNTSSGEKEIRFDGLYKYKNSKFKESLGEYEFDVSNGETSDADFNSGLLKNKKKRVIIFTLQS